MRRALVPAVLAALLLAPAAGAWTWPAGGPVLQPFLFDPAHPYAAGQHRGIDVGGDPGDLVLAPASGTVTFAGSVPSSGKSVTIETPDGYSVTLTHLGSITAARDATVSEGAPVGTIGPSGDSEVTQPYVHLGVRVTAEAQGYLDPLSLLPTRAVASPAPAPVPDRPPAPPPAPVDAAPAPASGSVPVAPPAAPTAADPPPAAPVTAPAAAEPTVEAASPGPTVSVAAVAGVESARRVSQPKPVVVPRRVARSPRPITGAPASGPVVQRPGSLRTAQLSHAPVIEPSPRAADVDRRTATTHRDLNAPVHRHSGRQAGGQTTSLHSQIGVLSLESAVVFLIVLPLALCAAALAAARRKVAPIIDLDALLRDDTDLLRERQAAHRACLHDNRRRHPRAASSAARRGDVLSHRRRRARDEGLAGR